MPGALYQLKERVTTLLAQYVADERAERADVVTQLGVLGSKLDRATVRAGVNQTPPPA